MRKRIVTAGFFLLLVGACAGSLVVLDAPVEIPPTPTPIPVPVPTPVVKVYKFHEMTLGGYQYMPWSWVKGITLEGRVIEIPRIDNKALQITYEVSDSEPMYIEFWVVDGGIPVLFPLKSYGARLHLHRDFTLYGE